jgi:hypothetical protein
MFKDATGRLTKTARIVVEEDRIFDGSIWVISEIASKCGVRPE